MDEGVVDSEAWEHALALQQTLPPESPNRVVIERILESKKLNTEAADKLGMIMSGLRFERDFYFHKMQVIRAMCDEAIRKDEDSVGIELAKELAALFDEDEELRAISAQVRRGKHPE
eukprot:gnl/Chilomastix_cuspidata/3765.p1 GENE.gnl/Chilomastix_cuspidata/3765~~gnl/Chilomastix_cuspidata/3765.p1  ORF type:complete len:117 (+),score=17.97 gnl/Chilomastix_cuspidata/3765:108-458(+)